MGKIEYFTIGLERPNAIYNAGENLRGTLNISVKERLKINGLKMLINGGARVHWSENNRFEKDRYENRVHRNRQSVFNSTFGKSDRQRVNYSTYGNSNRQRVHYSAYEKYLYHELVFMSKNSSSDLYIEPGSYSYPFDIALPQNLPTSFEHHIGQVRYSLYGTIDIPWAFDKHTTRSFTVLSHQDLNSRPNLRQGFGVSDQKVLCCGPCKSDPIIANFNIFKSGFVPGESLGFNATIDNKSSREVKQMTVNLIQIMRFHAQGKTKTSIRNVAVIEYPNTIRERSFENWSNSFLPIPSVCPSSNGTCRIIEISYQIVFNFNASGIAKSKDMAIPIIIGTIPLSSASETNTQNVPFTYEGCVFGANPVDLSNEIGINNSRGETIESDLDSFKPFYPFYKDFSMNNTAFRS